MAKLFMVLVFVTLASPSLQVSLARGKAYPTYPSVVDAGGAHMSYNLHPRHLEKRNSALDGSTFIKLEAFGENLVLNATVSSTADFENTLVEYWAGNGSQRLGSKLPSDCFLTGTVSGREGSWIALSRCGGLRGVIASSSGYLFVEPVESSSASEPQKHVVFKRGVSPSPIPDNHCVVYGADRSPQPDRVQRSVVEECFLEVAVVADGSMVETYGRNDLEAYLFTLMHIVSHLYREPSIGTAVTVALVRVVILDPDQPQFVVTSNAHMSLSKFCNWQRLLNVGGSPHHDIAVLVTRQTICEVDSSNCGTLGMAEFEGACTPEKSCNINRDSGLSTAFTIAHEMAHGLGVRHDGDPSVQCSSPNELNLMAPSFAQSENPHHWSSCSSSQLIAFLKSSSAHCVWNRPPVQELFSGTPLLPGMEFSAAEQCQLLHGNQATHCTGMQDECARLWCHVDDECVHQYSPPAAGTPCSLSWGESGVCYQGLCVEYSSIIEVVDGGWGEWEPWSSCSFTCGTSVQFSERFCDSPVPAFGGRYCLGQHKRYRTCNTQPCDSGVDYRQELCETSNVKYNSYNNWNAISIEHIFHLGIDPCKLHCVPRGVSTIFTSFSLADGASCIVDESRGVCVAGQCQPVDCDHQLGSLSYKDYCGLWCGNGSLCVNASGSFQLESVGLANEYAYYDTGVSIPAGSSNVLIQEKRHFQSNYIALQSSSMFLNGDFRILPQYSSLWFAGCSWVYERPSQTAETFFTKGPLQDNVTIYLLANNPYDGVKYSFAILTSELHTVSSQQPLYYWTSSEWGSCDAACGPGEEMRTLTCNLLGSNSAVDSQFCDEQTKPPTSRTCQLTECHYQWIAGNWSSCDAVCGQGVQTREVQCLRTNLPSQIVEDSFCNSTLKPDKCELCYSGVDCRYEWHSSMWSECDALCGQGERLRNVSCILWNTWTDSGLVSVVSEANCNLSSKPVELEDCFVESCLWTTSEWTDCDAECGEDGIRTRSLTCQLYNGTSIAAELCMWLSQPALEQQCSGAVCPTTSSCQDSASIAFCRLVTKYKLCFIHHSFCCASCSS